MYTFNVFSSFGMFAGLLISNKREKVKAVLMVFGIKMTIQIFFVLKISRWKQENRRNILCVIILYVRTDCTVRFVNRFCKQSLNDLFLFCFQKRSFHFRKKTTVFKNDPLVLNFQKTNSDHFLTPSFLLKRFVTVFIRLFLKKNDRLKKCIDNYVNDR